MNKPRKISFVLETCVIERGENCENIFHIISFLFRLNYMLNDAVFDRQHQFCVLPLCVDFLKTSVKCQRLAMRSWSCTLFHNQEFAYKKAEYPSEKSDFFSGVEPSTFRLLVQMLSHHFMWPHGDSSKLGKNSE